MTIGELLRTLPADKEEIQSELKISDYEFQKLREAASAEGLDVWYDRSDKVYKSGVTNEPTASDLEEAVKEYLSEKGLSNADADRVLKRLENPEPLKFNTKKLDFPESHLKYGSVSDTHIGHKMYRADMMDHAAKRFKKEGVEFIVHSGDILEGMSGRDGHVYELTHIGATQQLDYAIEELRKLTEVAPVYAITAENSHDGWFKSKNNMGLEVGPEIERRLDNFHFIGYDEADLDLDNGLTVRLRHPGGGTAYAISYKMQKYINAMSGGKKPNIVHQGHYHKLNYLFYRNIHAFDAGAFQEQTIYMKKKESPSHLAYTILDVGVDGEGGVDSIKPEFVTFYE